MVFSLNPAISLGYRGYDHGAAEANALRGLQARQMREEADETNALRTMLRQRSGDLTAEDPATRAAAAAQIAGAGLRGYQLAAPVLESARQEREFNALRGRWGAGGGAAAPMAPPAGGDALTRIAAVESGGNDGARNPNPGATAAGRFQITDGTWGQYAPRLGLRPDQRMDPAAQEQVARAIQADAERAAGRPLAPAEQYGAHLLGVGGLRAFLSADPNADAQAVYTQAAGPRIAGLAFQQNPGLLEPGMTVGQVMQRLGQRVGGGATTPAADAPAGRAPMPGMPTPAQFAELVEMAGSPNPRIARWAATQVQAWGPFMRRDTSATQPPTVQLGEGPQGPAGVYERTPQGLRYVGPIAERQPMTVGTIPPGFQLERGPNGEMRMVPIPGGPADLAEQRMRRAEDARRTGNERTGNIVVQDLDRTLSLIDTANLPVAGIAASTLARIPGTGAADAARLLDSVRANVGFAQLNQMRAESPTGAALGSVTERELAFLQSVLGSLDQTQSPAQFRDNLVRLRNVFLDLVHGEGNGPSRVRPSFQRTDAPPAGARRPDVSPETPVIPGPGNQGEASPPSVTRRRYNPATGRIE